MKIRTFARKARDSAKRIIQDVALRAALSRLERDLRQGKRPEAALLRQLAWGWGNQSWSASLNLLSAVLDWVPKTSGPILECGSGLTTLVLAIAAAQSDRVVISLEHNAAWAARVSARLPAYLRTRSTIKLAPIRGFGDFDWYSVDADALPAGIGLVLCDGPPGATRGGRYGLIPVMANRFAAGCVAIVDDTQRADELAILERWRSEFRASVLEVQQTYSVIAIGGNTANSRS